MFTGTVARFIILNYKPELALAAKAFVIIERVISVECRDEIFSVYCATKPLKTVIFVIVNLYIFNNSSYTNTPP